MIRTTFAARHGLPKISAGGRADDAKALFKSTADPRYRELLAILTQAQAALDRLPRIDMPGGKVIPQERNFGCVFGAR